MKTTRLILRKLHFGDAERLAEITNDIEVSKYLTKAPFPFHLSDATNIIERASDPNTPVWAIDDGKLVGVIGLRGEFGFWLAKEVWNMGYATEAAKAVLAYGFNNIECNYVEANPFIDNDRSINMLTKLGF